MKTKVGSLSDDPGRTRRFAVAIPCAIAITAVFVVLARCQPAERTIAEQAPALTVVLERAAPTPPPTPEPTPRPKPPPTPVPRITLAPIPQRIGTPLVHRAIGGAHTARRAVPRIATAAKTFAAPLAAGGSGTAVAAGNGSGTGSGDALGAGDSGAGGEINADAPCGFVDLIPFEAPDRNGSITYEHIRATVMFPDGHTESDEFPYRWSYPDSGVDPWSPQNMNDPNFVVRVQLPPDGANESRFPDVIRYILDHTRRETGTTTLQECPKPR